MTSNIAFAHLVGKIPFLAHEGCKEKCHGNACDFRRPAREAKEDFPNVDFSLVAEEDWGADEHLQVLMRLLGADQFYALYESVVRHEEVLRLATPLYWHETFHINLGKSMLAKQYRGLRAIVKFNLCQLSIVGKWAQCDPK